MTDKPVHIKFRNQQNPQAEFDVVQLEDVLHRENLDHSPLQLHLVEFYMIVLIEKGEYRNTKMYSKLSHEI